MPRFLHCLSVTGSFWYTIDCNPVNRRGLAGKGETMQSTKIALAVALVLLFSASAWSQTVSGSIAGSVLDSTQASVANAKVTAVEQNKKLTSTATTDVEGRFVFPQMQPGVYDIIVEMPGFKKYDKKNVT